MVPRPNRVRRFLLSALALAIAAVVLIGCGQSDDSADTSGTDLEDLSDEEVEEVVVDLLDEVMALCDGEPDQTRDQVQEQLRDLLSDSARERLQDRDLGRLMNSLRADSELTVVERSFERSRDEATLRLRVEVRSSADEVEERQLMFRFEHAARNEWRLSEVPECSGQAS